MRAGASLLIVLPAPANVHYGFDGWQNVSDASTIPNALGVHVLHLDTSKLKPGQRLDFTYWVCRVERLQDGITASRSMPRKSR